MSTHTSLYHFKRSNYQIDYSGNTDEQAINSFREDALGRQPLWAKLFDGDGNCIAEFKQLNSPEKPLDYFEAKADDWLSELSDGNWTDAKINASVVELLREQHRDTRHACSQAVIDSSTNTHDSDAILAAHVACYKVEMK